MKYIIMFILAISLSACSNQDIDTAQDYSYEVGSVTIISGGIEHNPHVRFAHSGTRTPDGETMTASGPFGSLYVLVDIDELPVVRYSDGFQIIVDGEDARRITYTVYNDNFELASVNGKILIGIEDLLFPDESGMYILVISVYWSYQAPPASAYAVFDYIIRVVR